MSDDHTRHEGDSVTLPGNPDLKQLATQAKQVRRGVHRGVPADVARFAAHHPDGSRLTADQTARSGVTLRDAQLALARQYGFDGWNALSQNVGRTRVEERDMHRWFGVEFNNEVWDLLDADLTAHSPEPDRAHALYTAYASARHWLDAGTVAHEARAEYMISKVAVAVGLTPLALHHARRCLDLITAHPDAMQDWDAPFAHEVLARALAASGDLDTAATHLAQAQRLTALVADPQDVEILESERSRGPWSGLPLPT